MSSDKTMVTAPSADSRGTVPAVSPGSAALPPDVRPRPLSCSRCWPTVPGGRSFSS